MTLGIRFAARSDVGLLREGNEDSAYAGPRLLAVADGMGGHAHGEVASAVAITALAPLDDDVPGTDLLGALRKAVDSANSTLHRMVHENPTLEGMGTTLTAMLWSGARVAVCHIGDSRAYLLRHGELYQITRDHTLVQSLVDEGRITADEAATHPQRSLLLRALDGRSEPEPDLHLREAQLADRYLLCSDGLSSVVSADTLLRTLSHEADPDAAVRQLIDLANRGGGPDNITCIVADVIDLDVEPGTEHPVVAGAAANSGHSLSNPDTPAGRARTLTQPAVTVDDDEDDLGEEPPPRRRRRIWPLLSVVLAVLVLVVAAGGFAMWRYSQGQYYVGVAGAEVAIYQGVNQRLAGYGMSRVREHTGIPVNELPIYEQQQVRATIQADSLGKAQQIVARLRSEAEQCRRARQSATPAPGQPSGQPTGKQSTKPGARPAPTPTPTAPAVPPECPGVTS